MVRAAFIWDHQAIQNNFEAMMKRKGLIIMQTIPPRISPAMLARGFNSLNHGINRNKFNGAVADYRQEWESDSILTRIKYKFEKILSFLFNCKSDNRKDYQNNIGKLEQIVDSAISAMSLAIINSQASEDARSLYCQFKVDGNEFSFEAIEADGATKVTIKNKLSGAYVHSSYGESFEDDPSEVQAVSIDLQYMPISQLKDCMQILQMQIIQKSDLQELAPEEEVDLIGLEQIEEVHFRADYAEKFEDYIGKSQRLLIDEMQPGDMPGYLESMKIYSNLPLREHMAFRRELANVAMGTWFTEEENNKILGCESSFIKADAEARKPGNQLSLEMRVPFIRKDGKQVSPVLLSVSAPALDTNRQPEWSHYVDKDGSLKQAAYRLALDTIASHIVDCADRHPGHRVVLSAYGMANFLSGLRGLQPGIAQQIGAESMAKLITTLRERSVSVAYSSVGKSEYWEKVKSLVGAENIPKVDSRDASVPGDWISHQDIIVNAWDPHSLVGNGCQGDNSFDGYVGRSSLAHYVHAYASRQFNKGYSGRS